MYAIDRKAIIKEIWKDTAYLIPCTLPNKDFWPSDVNAYDYNPAKAQQLLKDAGWNAGDSFEFWTYYTAQQQKDALQAMQQYLAQVGIKVTPKIMDVPAYNATFYTGEGWQFSYRGYGLPMGQSPRLAMLDSTQTNDKKSWAGNADPTLGQLLNKAEQSLVDADYTKGMQAVCKHLNDQVIEAPMWVGIRYGAITNKVKNFYYYPAPAGGPYEDHPELWEVGQ
jgi:peptide/nickel transport system substrate-binding protein